MRAVYHALILVSESVYYIQFATTATAASTKEPVSLDVSGSSSTRTQLLVVHRRALA